MKNGFCIIYLTLATTSMGQAQMAVNDPVTHALIEKQTGQLVTQWGEQLQRMSEQGQTFTQQLNALRESLSTLNKVKNAVGDPSEAVGLLDQQLLGGSFGDSGLGKSFSELSQSAETLSGIQSEIEKLYTPIDFQNPLQAPDLKGGNVFSKYQAVSKAFSNYDAILADSSRRGKELDAKIATALQKLDQATTDSEVQKIKGEIQGLQNVRSRIKKETDDAANQVKALHILNENYEAMLRQQSLERMRAEQQTVNQSAKSFYDSLNAKKRDDRNSLRSVYENR